MSDVANFVSIEHQTLYLSGPLGAEHAANLVEFLVQLKAEELPGTILINSEGGDEMMGFAMYDTIRSFVERGVKLTAIALGQVQSAAVLPFLACDERLAAPHAAFAIHHGTWCLPDPEPQREIPKIAEELMRLDEMYMRIIAKRTKLKMGSVRELTRHGHYFDTAEAIKRGFATGRFK